MTKAKSKKVWTVTTKLTSGKEVVMTEMSSDDVVMVMNMGVEVVKLEEEKK